MFQIVSLCFIEHLCGVRYIPMTRSVTSALLALFCHACRNCLRSLPIQHYFRYSTVEYSKVHIRMNQYAYKIYLRSRSTITSLIIILPHSLCAYMHICICYAYVINVHRKIQRNSYMKKAINQ